MTKNIVKNNGIMSEEISDSVKSYLNDLISNNIRDLKNELLSELKSTIDELKDIIAAKNGTITNLEDHVKKSSDATSSLQTN